MKVRFDTIRTDMTGKIAIILISCNEQRSPPGDMQAKQNIIQLSHLAHMRAWGMIGFIISSILRKDESFKTNQHIFPTT